MEAFVRSLGAQIKNDSSFDPYKASVSSTNAMSTKDVMTKGQHISKLDMQLDEMARIKKERIQSYEGKLDDREIEVYNHDSRVLLHQQ